jgi:Lipase (class 3)
VGRSSNRFGSISWSIFRPYRRAPSLRELVGIRSAHLDEWVGEIADKLVHGTTGEALNWYSSSGVVAQIDKRLPYCSNCVKLVTIVAEAGAVLPETMCQRALRALACSLLMALSGCASLSLSPTLPVPAPPSERAAMLDEIKSQYSKLLQMACLSSAAYVGQDTYQDFCQSWTHGPYTHIRSTPIPLVDVWGHPYNSYYIIWTDDSKKQQVVAIRGTDDLQDWEANLLFEPVSDKILQVAVHEGFGKYAQAVYDSLTTVNLYALYPGYDTYFAGHSLGGAAAVLTALYFYVQEPHRYNIKGVYTFGQPRVFDTRGATSWPAFGRNVYHVENCYDPVPLVPVSYDIFHTFVIDPLDANAQRQQYQHIGKEILLLNPREFWITDGSDIVRNLKSDIEVTYEAIRSGRQIDHSIGAYINRISELDANNVYSLPMPANPAYELSLHCLPYSLRP